MTAWHALPTELLIDIINLLPSNAVRALASTSRTSHVLCLPAIFADVVLPSAESLRVFAAHVPNHYGRFIVSLAVCTKHAGTSCIDTSDALVTILSSATHLQSLSLSLASSADPHKLIPAFAGLPSVHTLDISNCGSENLCPISERLVVSLAASLPSLSHLRVSRISRSAIHVDPCDVPYNVPIVMNDFDVPLHTQLGADLSLPSLLTLLSLKILEIRDTWLGCDSKLDLNFDPNAPRPRLQKLLLTGNMYTDDPTLDSDAYTTWMRACGPSLRSLVLGTALAALEKDVPSPVSPRDGAWEVVEDLLPHICHLHIDASLVSAATFHSTMEVLSTCRINNITVSYGENPSSEKGGELDEFTHQCALDDLEEWKDAVEGFLCSATSADCSALRHIGVVFGKDAEANWEL
ncbi:hypothetical protein V8B97DRAFT_1865478 [Scleroderma yunnanense]